MTCSLSIGHRYYLESGRFVTGWRLWDLLTEGNLIGSLTKNTGCQNHWRSSGFKIRQSQRTILLNTKSWLPSSVKIFIPQPRTSLTVSACPLSGPTVETLKSNLLFSPIPLRNLADVRCELSWVTSNSPHALAADAWTVRSGMRSQLKWAKVSISWVSWRRIRPLTGLLPTRWAVVGSAIGQPVSPLVCAANSINRMVVEMVTADPRQEYK